MADEIRFIPPTAAPAPVDPIAEIMSAAAMLSRTMEDRTADVVVSDFMAAEHVVLIDHDSVSRTTARLDFGHVPRRAGPRYLVCGRSLADLAALGLTPGPCTLAPEWIDAFHEMSKQQRGERATQNATV